MLDKSMMVGTEFPFLYAGTEATIELRNCFGETPGEQVVSSGDWVRTKPPIRCKQPINYSLQTQVSNECLRVLRHQQLTHISLNASLPHFVNGRGYGVFVQNVIPREQPVAGICRCLIRKTEALQKCH